ncbi:ROK family protein [Rothia sp. AR01]|uniref:ROK family protein n=1 Tax=Rothia santali TaxID=2949643 RepID=A0A9X2KIJ7_9MICC|nr:ROK family transcriptional regulator [Rothia santali]MCP3425904.1 ROK family protein [Rothia santali]
MVTAHARSESSSSQYLRRMNARKVLDYMWRGRPATATELMEATGLTRSTVLALCKDLAEQGWLEALQNAREVGSYSKGRPALRYAFRPGALFVVGVDSGPHRVSAAVADLRGEELARAEREFGHEEVGGEERRGEILAAVDAALAEAGVPAEGVGAMVIGVPAPVDAEGRSPEGLNEFWTLMNPELSTLGLERGWPTAIENDANLAALAELHRDPAARESSLAALLSGERFGAGLVLNGELLRQPRGGAGEMGMLELVEGVGSAEGLAAWARRLAREAVERGERTVLADRAPGEIRAKHVFDAAAAGDAVAAGVVERLADILARVCVALAGPLDLDRIVVSGGIAPAAGELVRAARERIAGYLYAPWLEVQVSELGADAVRVGAVHGAVEMVRAGALDERP